MSVNLRVFRGVTSFCENKNNEKMNWTRKVEFGNIIMLTVSVLRWCQQVNEIVLNSLSVT